MIVCDGFTGNVALKISEGLVDVIEGLLSKKLSVITDYSEYGVVMAHRFASDRFIQRIQGDIAAFAVSRQ